MSSGKVAAISLLVAVLTSAIVSFVGQTLSTGAVPDITRKGQEAAKVLTDAAGLGMLVVDERPSRLVSEGAVIEQHPAAGVRMPRGTTVLVVLSLGPENRAPKIALKPLPPAPAPPAPPPLAAAADADPPKADKRVDPPREVTVPKLYRKRLGKARQLLQEAGLELGAVTRSFNEDLPFGVIFRQRPRPGETVRKGTQVAVTVNSESDSFR